MHSKMDDYISQQRINRTKSNNRRQVLAVLSLFVVTSVFWCLKMTGITMAGEAFCGIDEHKHSTECGQYELICELQETEQHIHNESCIAQQLTCDMEETEGHIHGEACFGKDLICTQEEKQPHIHGEECNRTVYICGLEETVPHTHIDECMDEIIVCEQQEVEAHIHSADCFTQQLVCTEETAEHTHSDSCYINNLNCDKVETEGHAHSESCKEVQIVCNTEETVGHTHTDSCGEKQFVCTLEESEEHIHSDECYTEKLICSQGESAGHIHNEECYTAGVGFGCSLTETEGHIHTAECITAETQFGCGKERSDGHTHSDECYNIIDGCTIEEHIHIESCYSNINADLETESDWEATLAGVVPGARATENIVAVAQSQLGYTESTLNFEVNADGQRNGYSRYGRWYGNPYGQWNTMFVSFCLHYSQLEGIPLSAGAETMRLEWNDIGLFIPKTERQPEQGNLLFLDKNTNGSADTVAIVTAYSEGLITVIEGDFDNAVVEVDYTDDDVAIMGFGIIPDMSGVMTLEERALSFVAKTYDYTGQNLSRDDTFIVYTQSNGNYYAIDNRADAVPIYIDNEGNITADIDNINTIYWRFEKTNTTYDRQPTYYIQNVASNDVYLHPFNNETNNGSLTDKWRTAVYRQGSGLKLRGENQTAYLQLVNDDYFHHTNTLNNGSIMYLGKGPSTCYVWFDGTNGNLRCYGGSPNSSRTFREGDKFNLPKEWQSPEKYEYVLRGWYDVTNSKYYAPGAEAIVTGNMVFYADWVAATYDIGQFNAQVADTVSTSKFITTRIFDFNPLFNVMSANASVTVDANGHSETWTNSNNGNGNIDYNGQKSRNFMFVDQDSNGTLQNPNNRGGNSTYNSGGVTKGIYPSDPVAAEEFYELVFGTENGINPRTGQGVMGKTYLGTGDHLFKYGSDPNSEYYGYYYYDAKLNAASYNQSEQRFYVYEYLEATRDSAGGNETQRYDFLPLNSPYANTNGKNIPGYTNSGVNGEYAGVNHYQYDSAYNQNNNSTNNVSTNYSFGMAMDVKFHLPDYPGTKDTDGTYKNCDVYGKEMSFEFSGDDDLWVLVDGELVMDIGGIHQIESGTINFATGIVTVDGGQQRTINHIKPGEHVLTVLYLDRGGSMSKCAMYYNLAPRYSLNIQKEDVLSQRMLDGAKFAVYTDEGCTDLAELWTSEESYINNDDPAKDFTVVDGAVNIWGFSAGHTYYLKEISPPIAEGYGKADGIIRFSIDKKGIATYDVEVIEETDENGNKVAVSPGFTVHGVRIDEDEQKAYITVTNAQSWVKDTTTVQAVKIWEDTLDHSNDYVTIYLTVEDPDGTVRRIRETTLSRENNWTYIWTNLPKYPEGVEETEENQITYDVSESYSEGYSSSVSITKESIVVEENKWGEALEFENGEKYLLKTTSGYLATESSEQNRFVMIKSESDAKNSPLALWNATVSGGKVKFTNDAGQIINYRTSGNQSFNVVKTNENYQSFTPVKTTNGFRLYVKVGNKNYYIGKFNDNGTMQRTDNANSGLVFVPITKVTHRTEYDIQDWGFKVINSPLEEEASLKVTKEWSPSGDVTKYQQNQVTIKLLANGVDTGRTVTLTLKNNWTDTFLGLPYKDAEGNVIKYTVQESWETDLWVPSYGPIITNTDGRTPTYSTTVTNTYMPMGPALPSTGSFARLGYVLCGSGIMLASLIYGIRLRRKKERRKK